MLTKKLDRVPDELFQPVYEELIILDWNGIATGKIPMWHGFDFIEKEEYHKKKFTEKKYGDNETYKPGLGAPSKNMSGFWLRIPVTGPNKLYSETVHSLSDGSPNPDYIWHHIEYMDAPEGISSGIQKCVDWIYNLVGGKKLGRITVHNVTPGGIITRHRDSGEYFKYYHRFHLPITTNSKAVFKNDYGAEENMEAQYVHLLNCRDYHEVFNYGETDRIHIMIDIALDHPNQSF